jgi:ubiquinone biosynthesis protein UbiJ
MQVNLLRIITKIINQVLATNPDALAILHDEFADTVVFVEITDLALNGYVVVHQHGITLQHTTIKQVDITIAGRFMALAGMSPLAKKSPKNAWPKAIKFEGDVAKIEKLKAWLDDLSIDWFEVLSPYIGDFLAQGLVDTLSFGAGCLEKGMDNFTQATKNWVNDEASVMVAKVEVDEFLEQVDLLREQVDRLSVRIGLLQGHSKQDV